MENGADVHARNDAALCNAASFGRLEVVGPPFGHDAGVQSSGILALKFAAKEGHMEVLCNLLENGAEVQANDNEVRKQAS